MFPTKLFLLVTAAIAILHVIVAEEEGNLTFHTGEWINRTEDDHPDHENHEFVTLMSGELVDAMLKRRGLRGFDKMIMKACGPGRRSVAHFTDLVFCLRSTKDTMMDVVENFTNVVANMTIRDHIAVTTFCGVLPKIVRCKEELCSAIEDCEYYTGFLELVNQMHTQLIHNYCQNNGRELVEALSTTTRDCARHLLKTVHSCWGKAGLDYTDLTSVLRRLSKKEMLCQQLVGTQNCLAEQYSAKEECRGQLSEMVNRVSANIKKEYSCYKFGQEGNHLRDL